MKVIRLNKPKITVEHPQDKDVKVTLTRPSRADMLSFQSKLQQYEKFQPAINPETGEPILDGAGKVRVIQLPSVYPAAFMQEFLAKSIIAIVGVVDENQNPITDVSLLLKQLIEEDFDVTVKRQVPEQLNGKPTGQLVDKDISMSLYQYLLERVSAKGAFDSPLAEPLESIHSATPATSA